MKPILKLNFFVTILIFLVTTNLYSQINKSDIFGHWKLNKVLDSNGNTLEIKSCDIEKIFIYSNSSIQGDIYSFAVKSPQGCESVASPPYRIKDKYIYYYEMANEGFKSIDSIEILSLDNDTMILENKYYCKLYYIKIKDL